jgi:NADH dehydrogenase [ubiquinone] 1 alpha subcomplex assembly factor 7
MTPLERLIRERIAAAGPLGVADYMELCLGHPEHGYYATRDPFGAAGDFVTAPEIGQLFGEMIGAWLAQIWHDLGRPDPFVLAELGPGRGTLMADLLRVTDRLAGFAAAARVLLVETSPALRARQAAVLAGRAVGWAERVEALPEGPLLLVANEFFDALPVRQFRRADPGWQERQVVEEGGALRFDWGPLRLDPAVERRFPLTPDGTVVEVCEAGEAIAATLGERIARWGGAALIVDYGEWDGTGDTLQAVAGHAPADPLASPGAADLTAHVRFRALAEASGLRPHGPVGQGAFLERLGIGRRAARLGEGFDVAARERLAAQTRRLTHPAEMGQLFKVMALTPPNAPPPPGFDA